MHRPFHHQSTCLTHSGPDVVKSWSPYPLKFRGNGTKHCEFVTGVLSRMSRVIECIHRGFMVCAPGGSQNTSPLHDSSPPCRFRFCKTAARLVGFRVLDVRKAQMITFLSASKVGTTLNGFKDVDLKGTARFESHGQNLVVTVLHVPYSLDSGGGLAVRCREPPPPSRSANKGRGQV